MTDPTTRQHALNDLTDIEGERCLVDLLWIDYCRAHGDKTGIRSLLKQLAEHIVEDPNLGSAMDVARMLYIAIDEQIPQAAKPVYHVAYHHCENPSVLICDHCGGKQYIHEPILMDDVMAIIKQFDQAHAGCAPTQED